MNKLIKVHDDVSRRTSKETVDRVVEALTDLTDPSSSKFIPKSTLKKLTDNIVSIRQTIDN